jgi:hypothetical protein
MKRIIRLTESDLHRIVKESVNKILKEVKGYTYDPTDGRYYDKYGNAEDDYPEEEDDGKEDMYGNPL